MVRIITGYERTVTKFRDFSNDIMIEARLFLSHFKIVNLSFLQLIEKSVEDGSCTDSFVDKLVSIRKENPDFSIYQIKAELHTLLIGVRCGAPSLIALSNSILFRPPIPQA